MTSTERRDEMRKVFFEAWRKHKENRLLEPLEALIIDIILLHPEYQDLFDHPEKMRNIPKESNPLLHISLHLAIREQLDTDTPQGVRLIYENLCRKYHDQHVAEHKMLECLGQLMWDAKQTDSLPDEQYYLEVLRRIE